MIHVQNLCKSYRVATRQAGVGAAFRSLLRPRHQVVEALKDISFHIPAGEIVGYIGPNGAGKSSTIKVMSGILVPDSGSCRINGKVPWLERKAHVKDIGVVFGQRSQLWWDVPVADSFGLLREIYRISGADYRRTHERLVEMLDLGPLLGVPVRQLSLGQRMRCELAASLLHRPKILFLDEPTIGLDAPSKLAVRHFIKELNRDEGVTVILTTHDMNDIEALAQRILMIGTGRILYDGDIGHLRSRFGGQRTVTVFFQESGAGETATGIDFATLPVPGLTLVSAEPGRASWRLDVTKTTVSGFLAALSSRVEVMDLTVEDPPVEELILKLYQEHRL